jgi:hypothetical protein
VQALVRFVAERLGSHRVAAQQSHAGRPVL